MNGKIKFKEAIRKKDGACKKSSRDFRSRHSPVGENEGILQVTWGVEVSRVGQEWGKSWR